MATIETYFDVECHNCGTSLSSNTYGRGDEITLKVDICPSCIKEKNDEINDCKTEITSLENEIEILKDTINALEINITHLTIEKESANI